MKRLICSLLIGLMAACAHSVGEERPVQSGEGTGPDVVADQSGPALLRPLLNDSCCLQWVDSVMLTLDADARLGQLFIYTIAPQRDKANVALLRKVVEEYKIGGLLFSGGQMADQVALMNEAQERADVPLMMTFDGEWGLSMRLKNTPLFPRNMVLGCIRNDSLLYAYGREVARQCRELGVQVNFAPVADVNINPKNPVINTRSFGESPARVARQVTAYARGLEDGGVLSVSKHFPGHGDTEVDSHEALPTLPFSRERLDSVELLPFRQVIRAGLGGVMVGHLEVPALEPRKGVPASLSCRVVDGLLHGELGFEGLTFTDALAMKGVGSGQTLCLQALQAGNDLLLVPRRIKEEVEHIRQALKSGELSQEEIDRRCRKVLMFKYALGLHRKPHTLLSGLDRRIDTPDTRLLIRRLNLEAVTLLRNQSDILPLDTTIREVALLHVGERQSVQPFINTLSKYALVKDFRLMAGQTPAQRELLREKLSKYRRVVVCVAERKLAPYQDFFDELSLDVPLAYVLLVQGGDAARIEGALSKAEAVLLAHSTDEEVQRHAARLLYGEASADGRLSAAIGQAFPAGEGVDYGPHPRTHYRPEEHGMDSRLLACIDTIAEEGIREGAYPGCQIVVWKQGKELYNKVFGTHTGKSPQEGSVRFVRPTDVYDVASLTKTSATLLAVMKLYDKGLLSLTDRASDYLPWLVGTDKQEITIRQLLLHESGLPSTILFYQNAIDEESFTAPLFKARRDALHPVRIGSKTWANPRFRFREGLTSAVKSDRHTLQACDSLWLDAAFKEEYRKLIVETPLCDRRSRYSCVGFIVLQQVVEARTGMSLDAYLEQEFYGPMGLQRTGYLPLRRLDKAGIVPSNSDPFLRKATLQGYVHDESAAFQGGVSGNAGLFSTAAELACIYQMLLNGGEWQGRRYLSRETCRLFTTTASRSSGRGLGFDRPTRPAGKTSPCSESTPAAVYGHTGFTGACAWVDPENELVYVFLSNRIYPDAWNSQLMKLDIRPRIQEAIYAAMRRK
ncbi:MAG: serine hydrolase [Bacteroides sp.]|nr:serine hydrolase [Bacteroides sp.]